MPLTHYCCILYLTRLRLISQVHCFLSVWHYFWITGCFYIIISSPHSLRGDHHAASSDRAVFGTHASVTILVHLTWLGNSMSSYFCSSEPLFFIFKKEDFNSILILKLDTFLKYHNNKNCIYISSENQSDKEGADRGTMFVEAHWPKVL